MGLSRVSVTVGESDGAYYDLCIVRRCMWVLSAPRASHWQDGDGGSAPQVAAAGGWLVSLLLL